MDDNTSIGPAGNPSPAGENQPASEDVDAERANEFDMLHGLAGAEAKPFSKPSMETPKHASSSQPTDDPDRPDPNERTDTAERSNPGLHTGDGDPGSKNSSGG